MADLELAEPAVRMERRDDGTILLASRHPLGPYPASIGEVLRRWAIEAPDRPALAQRPGGDVAALWQVLTYAEVWRRAGALAGRLLDAGLGPDRPVAILSGNSIGHALVTLAGYLAGVPVVPISPAYSLLSTDLAKLRHIVGLTEPGLLYVEAPGPFARAIDATAVAQVWTAADLDTLAVGDATVPLPSVGPDHVAKILFTSGSTGLPKGVITTQRMMCSNQQALAQIWPFTATTPPVLCDWLPWSHVFGGSHNLNLALWQGGTMYVDGGRPTPTDVATTVRNLADVGPTISFNVPAGYGAILPLLEADDDLAAGFFRRLQLVFYAAAALPQDLWDRMEALSERVTGARVPMTSSWGATETAPMATAAHFPLERAGVVGVPVPGTTIKLVPSGSKLEVRVRGDNVTPGYFRAPELTAAAFDEEGFYRIGDAMRLVDPAVPERGLAFDGRVAEDFKLSTGTWVSVGTLRPAVLAACTPLLHDAVVTGHDRDEIGLVVWLTPAAAGRERAEVLAELQVKLAAYNAAQQGSSTRIGRFVVTDEPASIDRGEITDKGYLNQRAVLDARSALVQALHEGGAGMLVR